MHISFSYSDIASTSNEIAFFPIFEQLTNYGFVIVDKFRVYFWYVFVRRPRASFGCKFFFGTVICMQFNVFLNATTEYTIYMSACCSFIWNLVWGRETFFFLSISEVFYLSMVCILRDCGKFKDFFFLIISIN